MMRVIVDFVRGNLAIQRIVHPPFIASYTLVGVHWCLVAALFSVQCSSIAEPGFLLTPDAAHTDPLA